MSSDQESLEQAISHVEGLVQTGYENYPSGKPEHSPSIKYIFGHPDLVIQDPSLSARVNDLFISMARMEKATPTQFDLYDGLQENNFPFAEEVLRNAVAIDPNDNGRNFALRAYIAVAVENANVPIKITGPLLRLISGTYHDDYGLIRGLGDSRPKQAVQLPAGLKETLLNVVRTNKDFFERSRVKALCALVYFNIGEVVPILTESLQKYTQDGFEFHSTKPYVDPGFELVSTATALGYLTMDKRYRELVDFLIPEGKRPGQIVFSRELTQEVVRRIQSIQAAPH